MTTKQLRHKILDLAIHGRLVPQDPSDEPASALLSRIRAEKEQLVAAGKLKKKDLASTPVSDEDKPFDVPEGWEWVNIKEVILKLTDGTHHSPTSYEIGDYLYVTAKNIKNWGIDLSDITYVDEATHNEIYSRCNPELGDILYIKDGATTGVVTINTIDKPFSLLSSVALIKPSHSVSNKFLLFYLQSSLCRDSVRDSMKGVGITRITLTQIEKWNIPLPPLAEQQRIVAAVEQWMSLVDIIESGQENLHQSIALAKNKILDLAIKGKLVEKEGVWEEKTLGEVAFIRDNLRKPINSSERANRIAGKKEEELYPYYGATGQVGYIDEYLIDGNYILLGEDGAPFLDKFAQKAYAINGKCWVNNHVHVLEPKCEFQYLLHVLNITDYHAFAKGSTRLKLTQADMLKIPIPLPPLSEQHRIVAKIEELFTQLDNIAEALK